MSGVATAVAAGAGLNYLSGQQAADASRDAASTAAGAQGAALDYQKQIDRMPLYMRDQANNVLASWYGLPQYTDPSQRSYSAEEQSKLDYIQGLKEKIAGDTGGSLKYDGQRMSTGAAIQKLQQLENEASNFGMSGQQQDPYGGQQGIIDGVMNSPFYGSMIEQGNENIMRNASATGGFRSGTMQENLAQNSQNVLQGLTYDQLSGLQQFTNPNLNTGGIAGSYGAQGSLMGQGQAAAGQATQTGWQNAGNSVLQGIGTYASMQQPNQQPYVGGQSSYGYGTNPGDGFGDTYNYTLPNNQGLA